MVRLKIKKILPLNTIIIFNIFIFLTSLTVINLILEIPLIPYKVKGISKYEYFEIEGPFENLDENKLKMKLFTEQGNVFINTNLLFMANVKVGSNQQNFNLCLDTGSNITWIPMKNSQDEYSLKNHFDPNSSNTCRKTKDTFEAKYIDGSSTKGFLYYDNFYYIGSKNFQLLFGLANQTNFKANGDGLIGLAQHYDNRELSFIYMLNKGGVTTSRIFSLKFENYFNYDITGKLFIGQHQDFSQNNVATCPLERVDGRKDIWACKIKSLSVGTTQSYKRSNIIFDTGTNVLLLPIQYYEDLGNKFKELGCSVKYENNKTIFRIVCIDIDKLPNLEFEINNHSFIMSSDMIFIEKDDLFISLFVFATNFSHVIMGSPFFFIFHTLFNEDAGQMHFYSKNPQFLVKLN